MRTRLVITALVGGAGLIMAGGGAGTAVAAPPPARATHAVIDIGKVVSYGSGARAVAVNNAGTVAGDEYVLPYSAKPYVWRNGRMTVIPTSGTVAAMNSAGLVVGSTEEHFARQAFSYYNGKVTMLGYLGGTNVLFGHTSQAFAVNAQGMIVGVSSTNSDNSHAFLYLGGRMRDLGTLRGGKISSAAAVNQFGQVVGVSTTASGRSHATMWIAGRAIDLGTLGGANSYAVAVNDRGQVVGYSQTASGATHAFSWRNGRMTDLGVAAGTNASTAVAVNNQGKVLVYSYSYRVTSGRAYIWQNGRRTDLGGLRGTATQPVAINDRGEVAAMAIRANGNGQALLWDSGRLTALPTVTGGHYSRAMAINARGDVVGWSDTATGATHAVIWPADFR